MNTEVQHHNLEIINVNISSHVLPIIQFENQI